MLKRMLFSHLLRRGHYARSIAITFLIEIFGAVSHLQRIGFRTHKTLHLID